MNETVTIGYCRAEGRPPVWLVAYRNQHWNKVVARFASDTDAVAFAAALCAGLGLNAYGARAS